METAMRMCLFINRHNLSRQRLYETDPFWGKVERASIEEEGVSIWCRRPQGPLIRVCGMSSVSVIIRVAEKIRVAAVLSAILGYLKTVFFRFSVCMVNFKMFIPKIKRKNEILVFILPRNSSLKILIQNFAIFFNWPWQ